MRRKIPVQLRVPPGPTVVWKKTATGQRKPTVVRRRAYTKTVWVAEIRVTLSQESRCNVMARSPTRCVGLLDGGGDEAEERFLDGADGEDAGGEEGEHDA